MKKTPPKRKLEVTTQTIRVLTTELQAAAGGQLMQYPCTGRASGCRGSDNGGCLSEQC